MESTSEASVASRGVGLLPPCRWPWFRIAVHHQKRRSRSFSCDKWIAGCIRLPATLNSFVDHYGILDAEYERAAAAGKRFFVLLPTREPTASGGEYLVVIDSKRLERPAWSPLPRR